MSGCAVLILAGGTGSRVGAGLPKQYLPLAGVPVLRRTIEAFRACAAVDRIQVVIGEGDNDRYVDALAGLDLPPPVVGGATRQESAVKGLRALTESAPDFVLIHDAARPFVDAALIHRVLSGLAVQDAVLPAVPVTDTLKRSAGSPPVVETTLDRTGLWRAQTPQGFRFPVILRAHEAAMGMNLTDDTAVAEHAGVRIFLVEGNEDNFKITTARDFERAQRLAGAMSGETRLGTGFDVHAFGAGDHVVLCGVAIPHSHGLEGHSDADVAMHALTDALLGAIAEGDIGAHFPPSDPRWEGAASSLFLKRAAELIAKKGGRISNVDVTVICETPKVGPHRDAMRRALADILGLDLDRVSVKATTTEKLGFTGRGEGIAAQASVAVRLP